MPRRVPVLRQDHGGKVSHQRVDPRYDLITLWNCECSTGTEIILDVDDDEGLGHWGLRC